MTRISEARGKRKDQGRQPEQETSAARIKMAPPEHQFPVSELEQRVHFVTKNFKEKSRKLPKDFDLKKDCELYELVQYSCTTGKQLRDQELANPNRKKAGIECHPFVRLFRR